jgi:hypothetical protein
MGIRQARWTSAEPEHRLSLVESPARDSRATGRTAARRPAHRGHGALAPSGSDPDGHVHHGEASPAMAKRFQHVLDAIRRDVASQVGGLLWDGIEINPADGADDREDGEDGTGGAPFSTDQGRN